MLGLELQVSERGLRFHDPVAGQDLLSLTERGEALERSGKSGRGRNGGGNGLNRSDNGNVRHGRRQRCGSPRSRPGCVTGDSTEPPTTGITIPPARRSGKVNRRR